MSQGSAQWQQYWYHWHWPELPFSEPFLCKNCLKVFSHIISFNLHNNVGSKMRSLKFSHLPKVTSPISTRTWVWRTSQMCFFTHSLVNGLIRCLWKTVQEPVKSSPIKPHLPLTHKDMFSSELVRAPQRGWTVRGYKDTNHESFQRPPLWGPRGRSWPTATSVGFFLLEADMLSKWHCLIVPFLGTPLRLGQTGQVATCFMG